MKKKLFYTLIISLVLTACGATKLESNVKQIELGQTKQQVVNILGNKHEIVGATATPDGSLETWIFTDPNFLSQVQIKDTKRYILNFLDGRLVEWHSEVKSVPPAKRSHDHD